MTWEHLFGETHRLFGFLKDRGFTEESPSDRWAGAVWHLNYSHVAMVLTVELDFRDGFAGVLVTRPNSPHSAQYLEQLLVNTISIPPKHPGRARRRATPKTLLEDLKREAHLLDANLDAVIAILGN